MLPTFRILVVAAVVALFGILIAARGLIPAPEAYTRIGEVPALGRPLMQQAMVPQLPPNALARREMPAAGHELTGLASSPPRVIPVPAAVAEGADSEERNASDPGSATEAPAAAPENTKSGDGPHSGLTTPAPTVNAASSSEPRPADVTEPSAALAPEAATRPPAITVLAIGVEPAAAPAPAVSFAAVAPPPDSPIDLAAAIIGIVSEQPQIGAVSPDPAATAPAPVATSPTPPSLAFGDEVGRGDEAATPAALRDNRRGAGSAASRSRQARADADNGGAITDATPPQNLAGHVFVGKTSESVRKARAARHKASSRRARALKRKEARRSAAASARKKRRTVRRKVRSERVRAARPNRGEARTATSAQYSSQDYHVVRGRTADGRSVYYAVPAR